MMTPVVSISELANISFISPTRTSLGGKNESPIMRLNSEALLLGFSVVFMIWNRFFEPAVQI